MKRSLTKNERATLARDLAQHLQGNLSTISHSLDEVIGRSGTLAHTRQSLRGIQGQVATLIEVLERSQHGESALTAKEVEILTALQGSHSAGEIAESLHLSITTVKTHIASIYRKLGVSARQSAVAEGVRLGILRAREK